MRGRVLVDGGAEGAVLATDTPISLWGGLDVATGKIIDRHHPLEGRVVTDSILVLPAGRGSSTAGVMLLESLVAGTGPAALLLGGADEILAIGAIVADELFGRCIPVLELSSTDFAGALEAGWARIEPGGEIIVLR